MPAKRSPTKKAVASAQTESPAPATSTVEAVAQPAPVVEAAPVAEAVTPAPTAKKAVARKPAAKKAPAPSAATPAVDSAPVATPAAEVAPAAPAQATTDNATATAPKRGGAKRTAAKKAAGKKTASKKAPAKKAAAKRTAKKTAAKATPKKGGAKAQPAAEQATPVANGESPAEDGAGSRNRFFKVALGDEKPHGRFSGKKPKQAASKALTSILNNRRVAGEATTGKIKFRIEECTRNSKHKAYKYIGERVQLEEPTPIKIVDENGKEKEIVYRFSNRVTKDREGVVVAKKAAKTA